MSTPRSDAFKDRLAETQAATGRPELAHQSVGRPFTAAEQALADAMMEIYGSGVTDMAGLARGLAERGVEAPVSGRTDWDVALLAEELAAVNASLDAAYAENGYGA